MKNIFSKAQKQVDKRTKSITYNKDSKNRIIVNMVVENDNEFLSPFSESNSPIISEQVATFIENSTDSIKQNEKLSLHIKHNNITVEKQEKYRKAISEYYTQKYIKTNLEYRRNNIIVASLTLLGILVLTLQLLFDYIISNSILSEVINIFAWVLLWEAVDVGFFKNHKIKLKQNRYLSYIDMDITFTQVLN